MRSLTIASLLILGSALTYACNDTGTGGEGGAPSTGGGTGTGAGTGSGGGSGGGAADAGACSAGEFGTTVAAGTCNTINDFDGAEDFGATFGLESDGRQGAGVDLTEAGVPRLSGGKIPEGSTTPSGTGTLEMTTDAAAGGGALHFTFTGAQEWGGAFSHVLSNGPCYDASAYTGITFSAKATSAAKDIYVMVSTADSNPLYDCSEADNTAGRCFDNPRKKITLTGEYATYSVTWDELDPPGWGATDSFEVSRTLAVVFADAGADLEDNTIDLYIDSLAFTGGDASACDPADGMGMGAASGD